VTPLARNVAVLHARAFSMNPTRLFTLLLCACALTFTSLSEPPKKSVAGSLSKDVTAAQVNGTWEARKNTFKIWALGGGKLQVSFDGIYEYKSPSGPMANTGEASGIALIEGDTAIFHPEGTEETDKITLVFTGGKLVVKQEGTCGFGHRVTADGTYQKTSGKKPKFDE
jgi:hypothetical protein